MGLDIHIGMDNTDAVFDNDYCNESADNFHKHSLSRTFCNMMCRRDIISGEPELDQIGEITGIDISPLYEMNDHLDDDSIEWLLNSAETATERAEREKQVAYDKAKLVGNIEKIGMLIDSLISALATIHDLPEQLQLAPQDVDTLDRSAYFADLDTNPGDGYIGNNLGQDLRNFSRSLTYAKSKGSRTVYFNYG